MKNVSAFLKRHSALLLLVLVLATVPAGIAFGKYVKSVKVTNEISIKVSVATSATNYTIDKTTLKEVLQDLQTPATALYFVKRSQVPVNAKQLETDIKADDNKSGSIFAYQIGNDIYIAPADNVDARLYAPVDSSYFLSINYSGDIISGDISRIKLLKTIKCDNLDTSRVENMSNMFYMGKSKASDTALTTLDVSKFNTANVTDMSYMFCGCDSLTSLDVSKFNTTNVTNMSYMFYDCRALTSLDLNFNTSKVTDMSSMFTDCIGLTSLNVSSFDTSSVKSMTDMFNACNSLTSLDVSNFNTSNVTTMQSMFDACKGLTTLNVSNFKTSNVTDMSSMFQDCWVLTSLNVSSFDTSKVTSMSYMFRKCTELTTLDVSNFNTSNVESMEGMFSACSLTSLDLSSFDTYKVTKMKYMFYNCSNLTTIKVSDKFTTGNVTNSTNSFYMFQGCEKLVGGKGTPYNSSETDKTYAWIDGKDNKRGYFTGDLTTNSVIGHSDAPGISFD
mgnify:CR=1 FL=1